MGHIQRGGSPTLFDRVMASQMGAKAVEILKNGDTNKIVGYKDSKLVSIDIDEALEMKKTISDEKVELCKILSL